MVIIEEECAIADGMLVCRLFKTETISGPRPAILIFPDIWGMGEQPYDWARRFAAQGYVVLAVDQFGHGLQPTDLQQGFSQIQILVSNVSVWRRRVRAALDHLAARYDVDESRIGAIGFCIGGSSVMELARSGANFAAGICAHADPGVTTAEEAATIRPRLLFYNGAEDPFVPAEKCAQFAADMKGTSVDWNYMLMGGIGHSFTNPNAARDGMAGVEYNAVAARKVWDGALAFFDETFRAAE